MGIRIGIGSLKIGQGSTGVDWSSYWATRKPSALIVTGMRDTEIDFSWTDNSAGEASFKIYKSTDGVTYAADGTTLAGIVSYTATGLTAGALYYFYVVGVKDANESDPTNIYDTRFKITVNTALAGSANNTFILPTAGAGTYDYYVDWGEGGAEEHIEVNTSQTHVYAATGTYQVKIRGTFPRIYFNNAGDIAKLTYIDNWGNIKWTSMANAFYGCAAMNGRWVDTPNLSAVTDVSRMLRNCTIFNYSINNFDTSAVQEYTRFLRLAIAFKQPVLIDISAATALTEFLFGVDINVAGTTENYDATLIAWAAQKVNASLSVHFGYAKYSAGAAATARGVLTGAPNSWTIEDGGQV